MTDEAPLWDGLLDAVEDDGFRHYHTRTETLQLGARALKVAHLADFDQLYEELLARGAEHDDVTDERIPYWSELWPCAIAMAEYLQQNAELTANKSVLELGCGAGLAGLSAHATGGRVVFTDYLQDALDFAGFNWRLNFPSEADTRLLDWRNPDPGLAADVVLGADIAYEERAFEPILSALQVLTKPGGVVLVTEENRFYARGFLRQLARLGRSHKPEVMRVRYRAVTSRVNIIRVQM